jgi:hypothetical protein
MGEQVLGYLERLDGSERLDTWTVDDLTAALAEIANALADQRLRHPNVANLRLTIYRQRVLYEFGRRRAQNHIDTSRDIARG